MIFSNGNLSVLNEQQDSTKIDHIKAQKCWSVIYNTLIENFLTLRRDCQEYQTENKKGVYFQNHNIDQREESLMIKLETQNIEQFKFLIWQGAQNSNKNFIGHWIPFWKGENLCAGGYYNNQGIKIGLWNQLFEYYWDNAQITFYGIYHNGIKVQNWKIVYLNHIIGGGQYNQLSEKQGKWVEIDSNFYNLNKVKLIGEYHKGKKVGLWQIMNNSKIVGLGIFGYNGMKKGRWVELSENFWNCSILIQTGRYQNGKKEGIWSNEFKEDSDNDSSVIGGGEYNQNGLKDGNWIELHENFWNCCQVTYNGNYLYGKKIGKWQTIYADNLVGGGTYNYQGIKIEKWIELFETFQDNQQVFYQGQYQLGIKIGKWEILYHENDLGLQKLGGGDYDNKGRKQGFWVEPYFNFCDQCQIIYVGQYHQSKRIGQWKINFRVNSNEQFLLMQKQNLIFKRGEGFYDQKGRKQGNWVELQENFWNYNQILFLGQYEKGRKIGKWDTSYRNQSDQEFRLMYCYNRIQVEVVIIIIIHQKKDIGQNYFSILMPYCQQFLLEFIQMEQKQGTGTIFIKKNQKQNFINVVEVALIRMVLKQGNGMSYIITLVDFMKQK
ncbi:unnamed protein product [Paramecium sonneborni]|uniref:Uncharacterized protein n=1 Tax=Paramecium sonneborni TaxID=65129 RepID=A0A8S1PZA2_9CILI|nr:unnamed protein product [Paramecium sonneborni]